eukprot:g11504.t1
MVIQMLATAWHRLVSQMNPQEQAINTTEDQDTCSLAKSQDLLNRINLGQFRPVPVGGGQALTEPVSQPAGTSTGGTDSAAHSEAVPAPAPEDLRWWPSSWTQTALGGVRGFIRHPVKATGHILGHKMEVIQGSRKRPSYMPPKIPKHPLQDVELNMNEVLTYSDLKLRWQWTTRFSTSRMRIARHWKPTRTEFPRNKPTCSFIWHDQMPHRTRMPWAF